MVKRKKYNCAWCTYLLEFTIEQTPTGVKCVYPKCTICFKYSVQNQNGEIIKYEIDENSDTTSN